MASLEQTKLYLRKFKRRMHAQDLLYQNPNIGVIVTAAGLGARYGSLNNKVFETIRDVPVLIHSIRPFLHITPNVVVTTNPRDRETVRQLLETFNVSATLVDGGSTRLQSVQNGIHRLEMFTGVLVHDAARPNPSQALINSVLKAGCTHECVIPAIPVTDTIKITDTAGFVKETLNRSELRAIQTPQYFSERLSRRICNVDPTKEITDESIIMEFYGEPVFTVLGSSENLKLTVPTDIFLLTEIMRSHRLD